MSYMFTRAGIYSITATDTPDTSSVTDMSYMWYLNSDLLDYDFSARDVSSVTDMRDFLT